MKKIFIVIFLFLVVKNLNAQIKYGFKGGLNFSDINAKNSVFSVSTSNLTTFHINGFVDFPVGDRFAFQPGVTYLGKGAKYDIDIDGNTLKGEVHVSYLEVPMNGLAYFPTRSGRFFIGGGPYLSMGITGKIETTDSDRKVRYGKGEEDDLKRMDLGLNFIAGYHFNGGLLLNAGYGLGLSNVVPESKRNNNYSARYRQFYLSLGYSF